MIGTGHGGIGRYVFELVKNILNIDKENHYYLFYNDDGLAQVSAVSSQQSSVSLVSVNIRHYSVMEQIKFGYILNQYNLDLVHFPNFNMPVRYKKPFVVTIHDMVHHKISGAKKSRWLHFLAYKKVIGHAAKASRKIITVSHAAKKDIVDFLNVPASKIEVIYEGTSLKDDITLEQVEEVKKIFLLSRPYFLFVGVLERKKNLVNLARGFDEFLSRYGLDMDLVIAGKPDKHYPEIMPGMLQIKHSRHLVFTGEVSDRQLKALYKGSHAFVSASLNEGFGLPGVDAMCFGLPLVVANSPVFNEIYDNAAVYFNAADVKDIADKLHLIARDENFHKQMQEKSFSRSLMFDWKKTAAETFEVYQAIKSSSHQVITGVL